MIQNKSRKMAAGTAAIFLSLETHMARVILALALYYLGMSSLQFNSFLLESMGFEPFWIGVLQAISGLAALVSPIFPSLFLRWFGGPARPLLCTLLISTISLFLLPRLSNYWAVLLVSLLNSLGMSMAGPLITIHSMDQVRDHGDGTYFRVRSAGTAGFFLGCLLSFLFGGKLDLVTLYAGFAVALFLAFLLLIPDLSIEGTRPESEAKSEYPTPFEALSRLADPRAGLLLLHLALFFFAVSLAGNILGNYVVHEWSLGKESISQVWLIGTFFEIPLMFFCASLMSRRGLAPVLLLGLGGTVIKLVGLALAPSFPLFCLAYSFHGCFFAGAATAYDVYLQQRFGGAARGVLQPIVSLLLFSLPGILASLVSGFIWQEWGLWLVLALSGTLSVLLFLVGAPLIWLHRREYSPLAVSPSVSIA